MSRAEFKRHVTRGKKLAAKKQFAEAIEQYQAALKIKPNDLDTIFALGNLAREMHLYPIAVKWYDIASSLAPGKSEIQFNRAVALKLDGRNEDALAAFQVLAPLMPENDMLWNNLGNLLMQLKRPQEAVECLERAVKLKPKDGRYWNNYAMALMHTGSDDDVIAAFEKAEKDLGKDPIFHINVSHFYFSTGRMKEGWEHYDWRYHPSQKESIDYLTELPWWKGEDLTDKTILISPEQGIGDQISFASCLPEIIEQAGKVIIEVGPKLAPLFQRSFPKAEVRLVVTSNYNLRQRHHYEWLAGQNIDFFAPIGRAFEVLRPDQSSFPMQLSFLKADPERAKTSKEKLEKISSKPKIGLSWRSGVMTGARNTSYLDISSFFPVMDQLKDQYDFVSLQYKINADELERIEKFSNESGARFFVLDDLDLFDDIDGTLALIDNLDLVYSVRNTQLNLAGSIGKKAIGLSWTHLMFGVICTDLIYPSVATNGSDGFLEEDLVDAANDFERCFVKIASRYTGCRDLVTHMIDREHPYFLSWKDKGKVGDRKGSPYVL